MPYCFRDQLCLSLNEQKLALFRVVCNFSVAKRRDDDETSQLSNSMMSVISSTSSLASEVLERAAQRQRFWKTAKA